MRFVYFIVESWIFQYCLIVIWLVSIVGIFKSYWSIIQVYTVLNIK